MNRQKIMANRRRDIIIIVGCTILALIGGYGWSRGFGNFTASWTPTWTKSR